MVTIGHQFAAKFLKVVIKIAASCLKVKVHGNNKLLFWILMNLFSAITPSGTIEIAWRLDKEKWINVVVLFWILVFIVEIQNWLDHPKYYVFVQGCASETDIVLTIKWMITWGSEKVMLVYDANRNLNLNAFEVCTFMRKVLIYK